LTAPDCYTSITGMMKKTVSVLFLALVLFSSGCGSGRDFDSRVNSMARPYLFSIAGWETETVPEEVWHWLSGDGADVDIEGESGVVIEYFDCVSRINSLRYRIGTAAEGADKSSLETELSGLLERKTALVGTVEKILEKQIRDTLAGEGIYNPAGGSGSTFPPVNFRLEELPSVLVISPRDHIESLREFTLRPGMGAPEMESLEANVDGLGVSSLVNEIGGIATYPSIVDSEGSLRFTLDTATEEWLHQYLAFKPLGFRYVLDLSGISRNYEIATMNETLAGMVSKEIGSLVYEKYYSGYKTGTGTASAGGFDFDLEMREIRKAVDAYLAKGEIEQAEEFMETKRRYLATQGYYLRKLNQAYFAFHGAYADRPAYENPIGLEMKELRNRSASLKEFLETAAAMTGSQDLQAAVR
jgi:hypothetical protein